jgi:hypothetical protein
MPSRMVANCQGLAFGQYRRIRTRKFMINRVLLQVLAVFLAVTALNSAAVAAVKVHGDVSQIQTVAVVGYSFYRDVEMEVGTPFKPKAGFVELTEEDPEYLMMQEADERVLEALQALGTFSVMPREEVLANEFYQSSTKDPSKKFNLAWYFPKDYREVKLKKKSAKAFCEALGVDAVVLIEFKHALSESSSTTLGVFGKSKKSIALKGEITMFDRDGTEIISGSAKSDSMVRSTSQSWGDQDDGVSFEKEQDAANMDQFWSTLLTGYLEDLQQDLGQE